MHTADRQPEAQTKMMAQLAELNDEIGADDWTIARAEITRRKLIKQTPRYRVYRADWFGDVLVYEPVARQTVRPMRQRRRRPSRRPSGSGGDSPAAAINQAEFKARLDELCLDLDACSRRDDAAPGSADSDAGADSAYSSISSSPQYYTKHSQRREFEFPASGVQARDNQQQPHQEQQETRRHTGGDTRLAAEESAGQRGRSSPTSRRPLVVLNRDSFPVQAESDCEDEWARDDGADQRAGRGDDGNYDCSSCCNSSITIETEAPATSCGWFELNELRLVAHENFILFMGASIENSARAMSGDLEQTASLVMQTSHPRSVSLHDLLHANRTTTSVSPASQSFFQANRFFAPHHPRQPMGIETKLNICQQVTDAMTYLHDKNIVHGRLTSLNVYIEPNKRVKISLIDTDERQIGVAVCGQSGPAQNSGAQTAPLAAAKSAGNAARRPLEAAFNLSTLTYLSPELIRTIRVAACDVGAGQPSAQVQMDTSLLTRAADVFSFGTLLFELFEERFPFSGTVRDAATPRADSPASLLSLTGSGRPTSSSKLVHSLFLDAPSTPRGDRLSPARHSGGLPNFGMMQRADREASKANTNCNIKTSASELIYQIGSGQIAQRNSPARDSRQKSYPALVEHIISACWASDPKQRPSFKQLRFEQ